MIHENATAHPEQPVTAAVKLGVSVVICCHNSAKLLPPTLEHLRKQQVDPSIPWEAIIVDNASTDATAEIARKLWPGDAPAPLRIVREPQLGLSNARRRGFAEAKYEIVSFIDDDNWVANNWIDTVSKIMSASPVLGALGGLVYPVYEVEPPTWFHDYRHYCAIRTEEELTRFPGSQDTLVGAGLNVRKEAWIRLIKDEFENVLSDRIGTSLSGGGDFELTLALKLAGWHVALEPSLKLQHFIPKYRLEWSYMRRLVRASAASLVALDSYYAGAAGLSPRANFTGSWAWHAVLVVKEILRDPRSLSRWLFSRSEGDAATLQIEHRIGRLIGLIELGPRYAGIRRRISNAPWRALRSRQPQRVG